MVRRLLLSLLFIAACGAASGSLAFLGAPMMTGGGRSSGGGGGGGGTTFTCDIGPNYVGNAPAAAVQAFGNPPHCAANYDFTQTGSWTDARGNHTWSTLASWLSCGGGGNAPAPALFYFGGVGNNTSVNCDVNHQTVGPDPSNGNAQAFIMSYFLTDFQNNLDYNQINSLGNTANQQESMPSEYYVEQVLRTTAAPCTTASFSTCFDISTFSNLPNHPCFVVSDMGERDNTTMATGSAFWNSTCGTSSGGGVGYTTGNIIPVTTSAVSTTGYLMTADDVSNFSLCAYYSAGSVSGLPGSSFLGCLNPSTCSPALCNGESVNPDSSMTVVPPANSSVFNTTMHMYWVEGPQNAGGWTATSHSTYVARVTVWECAAWPQQCYTNPVITSHP